MHRKSLITLTVLTVASPNNFTYNIMFERYHEQNMDIQYMQKNLVTQNVFYITIILANLNNVFHLKFR